MTSRVEDVEFGPDFQGLVSVRDVADKITSFALAEPDQPPLRCLTREEVLERTKLMSKDDSHELSAKTYQVLVEFLSPAFIGKCIGICAGVVMVLSNYPDVLRCVDGLPDEVAPYMSYGYDIAVIPSVVPMTVREIYKRLSLKKLRKCSANIVGYGIMRHVQRLSIGIDARHYFPTTNLNNSPFDEFGLRKKLAILCCCPPENFVFIPRSFGQGYLQAD